MKYGKWYICRTLRLLEHLMKKGHKFDHQMPDARNPAYTVWVFENSPQLEADAEEYFKMRAEATKQ